MSEFNFTDVSSEKIANNLINDFEEYTGETLPLGDARRQFLQGFAYVLVGVQNNINETGKKNLLRYSTGDALDMLGELMGVKRLDAEPATVTLKFTLSSAQSTAVTIPQGTRATADGKIFFATDKDLVITSGSDNGTVTATATTAGAVGNGFVSGQITNIVDGVAYVGTVTNTTTSIDGRDIETDEEMRERIRIAPFSYSTAGSEQAYIYYVKTANSNVGDVSATKTSAGNVTIAIVKKDGTLPTTGDGILADVTNAVSAKDVRPLTDNVTVAAATAVNSTINVEYYISKDNNAKNAEIQTEVSKAVQAYKLWQSTKIGRDINPDKLRMMMFQAGAEKVTVTAPTATTVDAGKVAQFTSVSVTYKGECE